eukprot:4524359-Pyramimonas_sp.AAC.1
MREGWNAVFSSDDWSWAQVRGPISVPRMTLYRLGWTMPIFCTSVDDFGRGVSLVLPSPNLIKFFGKAAVLRSLERASGDKYGVG